MDLTKGLLYYLAIVSIARSLVSLSLDTREAASSRFHAIEFGVLTLQEAQIFRMTNTTTRTVVDMDTSLIPVQFGVAGDHLPD